MVQITILGALFFTPSLLL